MGKTLYLECNTGISGDMSVAALLDLGADQDVLKKALDSLNVTGFETEITRVKKSGLDVCDFNVKLDKIHENHDHDMEYLHGKAENVKKEELVEHVHDHEHSHEHPHDHEHSHEHVHDHEHSHEHPHDHEHSHEHVHDHEHCHKHVHDHEHTHSHEHSHDHHHPHEHRGMPEILEIIDTADMTDGAKALAKKIFGIIAEAEAKAHGVPLDQVHFHEVGAVDSIVDVVAVAVCADNLDITETIVPKLCEGTGTVRCQHGILPVPVPAVSNIIAATGLNIQITGIQGELVTPTGAAIAAALKTSDRLPSTFSIEKIGLGAGKRKYERPSILRAMLIRSSEQEEEKDTIYRLESNIDDCTGEELGYVMERLMEAGARDVNYIPVFMKKNRPAYQLNVICKKADVKKIEDIIFMETTTIGIRKMEMERRILKREQAEIETPLGKAQVKICTLPDGKKRCYPEYESAQKLAKMHEIPLQEVFRCIQNNS